MLRRLYDWVMDRATHPNALWTLAAIAFAESSFFPIPPDVLLIPMVLADRSRAFLYAAVCTVCSVVGGLLGYAIGYYLYQTIGLWLINLYGLQHAFDQYQRMFAEWGLWIILIKGMTPIPYKLVTIASGVAKFDLTVFILASIATRGARFFLECLLLWHFGAPIRSFIEERFNLVTWIFLVGLVGGFIVVKYIV